MDWMLMPLRRYADFEGRSRRMEYWMFQLFNVIVLIVPLVLIFSGFPFEALANPDAMDDPVLVEAQFGPLFWVGVVIASVWALVVFIPSIAVTIRRLHDRDMSGWWYLGAIVAGLLPLVGWIASIALFVITVLPGTPGPNRFGPDPLDPGQADVFS